MLGNITRKRAKSPNDDEVENIDRLLLPARVISFIFYLQDLYIDHPENKSEIIFYSKTSRVFGISHDSSLIELNGTHDAEG